MTSNHALESVGKFSFSLHVKNISEPSSKPARRQRVYQNLPRTQNQREFLPSHHGNAMSLSPPTHRLCSFDHPRIPCKPRSRNVHLKFL